MNIIDGSKNKTYIKKEIINIFDKHLGNDYLLINFGSFAGTEYYQSSDIDLAVYRTEKITDLMIAKIKDELETETHTLRDIDLINLTDENIPVKWLKNILEGGTIWKKPENSEELLRNLKKRLINIKK